MRPNQISAPLQKLRLTFLIVRVKNKRNKFKVKAYFQ